MQAFSESPQFVGEVPLFLDCGASRPPRDHLHEGGVQGHGLGALGHGVLGELARKDTADPDPPQPEV
jgi:hypothetical protein